MKKIKTVSLFTIGAIAIAFFCWCLYHSVKGVKKISELCDSDLMKQIQASAANSNTNLDVLLKQAGYENGIKDLPRVKRRMIEMVEYDGKTCPVIWIDHSATESTSYRSYMLQEYNRTTKITEHTPVSRIVENGTPYFKQETTDGHTIKWNIRGQSTQIMSNYTDGRPPEALTLPPGFFDSLDAIVQSNILHEVAYAMKHARDRECAVLQLHGYGPGMPPLSPDDIQHIPGTEGSYDTNIILSRTQKDSSGNRRPIINQPGVSTAIAALADPHSALNRVLHQAALTLHNPQQFLGDAWATIPSKYQQIIKSILENPSEYGGQLGGSFGASVKQSLTPATINSIYTCMKNALNWVRGKALEAVDPHNPGTGEAKAE